MATAERNGAPDGIPAGQRVCYGPLCAALQRAWAGEAQTLGMTECTTLLTTIPAGTGVFSPSQAPGAILRLCRVGGRTPFSRKEQPGMHAA